MVSLRACYVSGTQPRDPTTICDWSATVTVEVSYLAGTEAETATTAGGMPYGTGVTKGGGAYVNIPVAVVPGVNGLQPALSIDYSDGRERQRADEEAPGDILGYGWRIGGLSAIRRCVRNTADADGISLDATDGLCIDGEPLVRTTGIHLRPGANYRTLRESHARITVKGTVASPWFEVALPDGRVREYGNTGDSELRFPRPASASAPLLWSINKETDAFGNEMAFEYRETESLGARHPKRIVYGDGGDAEVVFEYTGRGDVETAAVRRRDAAAVAAPAPADGAPGRRVGARVPARERADDPGLAAAGEGAALRVARRRQRDEGVPGAAVGDVGEPDGDAAAHEDVRGVGG